MSNKKLPAELHTAYNWTDAAGEIDELRTLTGAELDAYCTESAENNAQGDANVTAADLHDLHDWLVASTPYLVAVDRQHVGTCEALRWTALSIAPFVLAKGDDMDDVLERAAAKAGHDDIHVESL